LTEADNFARTIARFLAESIDGECGYTQVIIVAAPAFLGMLREHMTPETLKRITLELDKNLTQHHVDDIRSHLPAKLPSLGR
jgi:protein required for attachment to host cells